MDRARDILLVEDNPGDVRLMKEALKEGKTTVNLHHVGDGVEALSYLKQKGSYARAPRPDLVLLDLNLPKKDGREVLGVLKHDPALLRIPVVVLTTSNSDQDIQKSYDLHANCYITKPVDFDEFIDVMKSISHFWLQIASIPR